MTSDEPGAPEAAVAGRHQLLLADWLPPDFGAIGQYTLQHAAALADLGHHVAVVGFSSRSSSFENPQCGSGSISIRRVFRGAYDRGRLLQRAWWTVRANLVLLWSARRELRRADEVIFTGSPPYLLHFIAPLKFLLRGRLRYRIADFHPECLIAARGRRSPLLALIERLTWFWRRRVDVIEIIAEDQRARLLAHGIRTERIELRRDRSPISFAGAQPAALPPELRGRKVILYSGNWGVAHDAETFVAGMARLDEAARARVAVWLNATGARVDQVEAGLRAQGIAVHRSAPCALADLPSVLLAADLHLITLSDAFVGLVLPSKVYACIDSGRPILFVGSAASDVHALALSGACRYARASVGDSQAVADGLLELLDMKR